jgi:hypothetical protein
MKNSVGWQIAINAKIGFKLQVTAIPGLHSLYECCFQTKWLFSGVPEDPEDDSVMVNHGVEGLYSTVESVMHAIRNEDEEAQQDVLYRIFQIKKP